MRILFIHQNFPGQFKLLAAHLAQQPDHQVVGLGDAENVSRQAGAFAFPVFGYRARPPRKSASHHFLASFEAAIRRGQDVVLACQQMQAKGFVPDLVIDPHPLRKSTLAAAFASQGRPFLTDDAAVLDASSGRYTCLLYTSPSPRDGLLSRMPSSA